MKRGVLSRSKIRPDRKNAGRNPATIEVWAATNWIRIEADINSPKPREASIKRELKIRSAKMEPRNGT